LKLRIQVIAKGLAVQRVISVPAIYVFFIGFHPALNGWYQTAPGTRSLRPIPGNPACSLTVFQRHIPLQSHLSNMNFPEMPTPIPF
jgi:hypothetical protein